MNNTTIINTFNSDNSNITNINTKLLKIMTTITGITLKYKKMIAKKVVTNLTLCTVIIFSRIKSFT